MATTFRSTVVPALAPSAERMAVKLKERPVPVRYLVVFWLTVSRHVPGSQAHRGER